MPWAADTILQLVAEVERLNKIMPIGLIDLNNKIEKLTAANKIMRDKLVDVKSQLDAFKCGACSTTFSTVSIDDALAEADEVMK